MATCSNCGKTNCDCQKYENEIEEMKAKYVPMSHEEKMRRVMETVRRWKEKAAQQGRAVDAPQAGA